MHVITLRKARHLFWKSNNIFGQVQKSRLHACTQPLKGIRVLDIGRIMAAPYCSMMLADMGAEVIKVEKPGSGDDTRVWGPPFAGESGETAYFLCANRNKKSICVDMKSPDGQKVLQQIAAKCDVFIENFIPG
eukprot:322058_1